LFWRHRLNADDEGASWQIPYADLVTLLLAVFVLIATMSELRAGTRFDAVRGGLRMALGFGPGPAAASQPAIEVTPSLAERLRLAGVRDLEMVEDAIASGREARYDVLSDPERVIVRMARADVFAPGSGQLGQAAEHTLQTVGRCLAGGQTRLEVCAYAGRDEAAPDGDLKAATDLPYARALACASVLTRVGVSPARLRVTAIPAGADTGRDLEKGLDIIIRAAPVPRVSPRKSS
jgi:flagellar motor protein MotB